MEELADERRVVKSLLERRDIGGWLFEVDGDAREHSIRDTSLREVETADLYIGLFWRKYGEVTAAEYEHARRMGKSCLIFEKRTDLEPGRESGLRDFLGRVGQIDRGVTVSWFTTLGDLEDKVTRSVSGWVADTVRGRADAKVAGVYGVAPLPAHYVARYKWVTCTDRTALSKKELEQFVRTSYELVAAKLPKKTRRNLGLEK